MRVYRHNWYFDCLVYREVATDILLLRCQKYIAHKIKMYQSDEDEDGHGGEEMVVEESQLKQRERSN